MVTENQDSLIHKHHAVIVTEYLISLDGNNDRRNRAVSHVHNTLLGTA